MSAYPLLDYNWIDASGSMLPIANLNFAYGTLGTSSSSNGGYWGSLTIPTGSLFNNNNNLVTINGNGIQFNVSGIYQITTTLQFTGPSITGGTETFAFSYSTSQNTSTSTATLSSSVNNIAGPISFLDGSNNIILASTPLFINGSASGGGANLSNGFDSTNYGGNVSMLQNTTTTPSTYPPFFLLPNYMTSSNKQNVNTITSIYYIPVLTTIYFNIANTLSTNSLNATGNFTVELMNYVPYFVTNVTNLTVSTLNYSNGYYYYTFVPTNTALSGTATIQTPTNVTMNYLLVGGGGGGGGSYSPSMTTNYGGGGGGGGQVSNSSISGSLFNITVGNAGAAGAGNAPGSQGGSTILNTVTATGGGGGLTQPNSTGGTGGGGQGSYFVNNVILMYSMDGGPGTSGTLNAINYVYNVGGAGGGGGFPAVYSPYIVAAGTGGSGATGGIACDAGTNVFIGTNGNGYGTGGGGAGMGQTPTNYAGGQGGPGFAVLYWKA